MLDIHKSLDYLAEFFEYHYQLLLGGCRVALRGTGIVHVSARPVQNGKVCSARILLVAVRDVLAAVEAPGFSPAKLGSYYKWLLATVGRRQKIC
jgi:hypothetical protein